LPWELYIGSLIKTTCQDFTVAEYTLWLLVGVVVWTLFEYVNHRLVFHGEDTWMHYVPFNRVIYILHFTIHGIHHAFPQDRYRLAFPPVPGYAIAYFAVWTPI
jgi:4-hydroxysphinganine ceramide fatty acyl 2-hydroxylase